MANSSEDEVSGDDDGSGSDSGSENAVPNTLQEVIDYAIGSQDLGQVRAALQQARVASSPLASRLEAMERHLADRSTGLAGQQRAKLWRHYNRKDAADANGLGGDGAWSPARRVAALQQQLEATAAVQQAAASALGSRYSPPRADAPLWEEHAEQSRTPREGSPVSQAGGGGSGASQQRESVPGSGDAEQLQLALDRVERAAADYRWFDLPGRYRTPGLPGSPAGAYGRWRCSGATNAWLEPVAWPQ